MRSFYSAELVMEDGLVLVVSRFLILTYLHIPYPYRVSPIPIPIPARTHMHTNMVRIYVELTQFIELTLSLIHGFQFKNSLVLENMRHLSIFRKKRI